MNKRFVLVLPVLAAFCFGALPAAQFKEDELAQRARWEEFLRKAKIIKSEAIGEGVTKPMKLLLRKGDTEAYAVWKRPGGTDAGFADKWECEIAAYRLDKLLGVNMVPPTVERSYRFYAGSLQLWVELEVSEKKMMEAKISVPEDKLESYEKMRALQRAFDCLIANSDRSLQNLRYTPDWRMILIDHSRSFRAGHPYLDRLLYGKNGLRTAQNFIPLPRRFVEKVKLLHHDSIRNAVEFYLTSSEIAAILGRKKLLLREIDELITEKGEGAVLYD